jgi:acyl CoA:acetate/3-ketoacid CoA transferase beta subunit
MAEVAAYTIKEQMIVSAAREIRDDDVIYAGVGIPNVAVLLAKFSHAPSATIVYETGIIRREPCVLGLGVDVLPTQYLSDMLTDVAAAKRQVCRRRRDLLKSSPTSVSTLFETGRCSSTRSIRRQGHHG